MKKHLLNLLMFAALGSLLMGCMASAQQCTDFASQANNTRLGLAFSQGGYAFTALDSNDLFVNDIAPGVHGLQFGNAGIEIKLSQTSQIVELSAGSYAGKKLSLTALDSTGSIVDTDTIGRDSAVHNVSLSGRDITVVSIVGGGYEGILVKICSK